MTKIWKYLLIIGISLFVLGLIKEKSKSIKKYANNKISNSSTFVCQPHSQTDIIQKRKNVWLIGIDGSNEYDKERMGHNTKIKLKPGEKAEIEFIGGKISYHTDDDYTYYYYPWGNRDYSAVKKYLGESVRYEKIKNAGNSVLAILRSGKKEKVYKINSKTTMVKNMFSEPATIFLFYNGKEFHLNSQMEIEDTFQWAGCDGSKMYFGVYKTE